MPCGSPPSGGASGGGRSEHHVTGAILTGGSSRRMGTDKAFVPVDGQPMVRRVADALTGAGASSVRCIGGDLDRLSALGLAVVPDRWPGEGPLGGLVTALAAAPGGRVLVAGCDQPWLRPALLRLLVDPIPSAAQELVPPGTAGPVVFSLGGRPQPLPGLYPAAARAALEDRFLAGHRRLGDALGEGTTVVTLRSADAMSVRDVDRLGDLLPITLPPPEPNLEVSVEVPEIDVDGLATRQEAGAAVIDVRMPDEYVEGHVPGAVLIPLPEVPERLSEVPTDQPVLVICKSGGRSMKAAEFLRAQGVDATNVAGGTMAWIDSGREVVAGEQPR